MIEDKDGYEDSHSFVSISSLHTSALSDLSFGEYSMREDSTRLPQSGSSMVSSTASSGVSSAASSVGSGISESSGNSKSSASSQCSPRQTTNSEDNCSYSLPSSVTDGADMC
mmetsp:Transcript_35599/g.61285  ORF Transcript_35599/g.61285 Transcript_35599/m.61285 type:complete len:112 (-) Transcript_35599:14-349(-)